ncbi:MAG: hypothetical protein WCG34_07600, partial [Leptolinea sp.]
MKLTSFPLAVAIFVLMFGGIGFTTAMNWWQTESTKIPAKYSEGEAAGEFNPADIRGSYTFESIKDSFGIPLEDLRIAFRVPAGGNTAAFSVKSLETLYTDLPVEMGTGSVRLFTAFYKGLPYDLSANADTYLFPEAAEILKTKGSMTPDQAAFLPGHTLTADLQAPVDGGTANAATAQPAADSAAPVPTVHVAAAMTVTGQTTFQNLLDWGVKPDAIAALLGEPMPEPGMLMKDYFASKG